MFAFSQLDLLRCRLIGAYERPLPDMTVRAPYIHDSMAAWLVQQGELVVYYHDGQEERYRPGEWVFPREAPGEQLFLGGLRILAVRFVAEWSPGEPLFPRRETVRIAEKAAPALTHAARALAGQLEAEVTNGPGWELAGTLPAYWKVQALFMEWMLVLEQTLREHGRPVAAPRAFDPKVKRALDWLQSQPPGAAFRLATLAEAVGSSVSQLNKLFTQQTGQTPAAYWQRRKLEAARAALMNGSESIKAIAYQLGFSSPEHFAHWFRRHHGSTPTALRQQAARGVSAMI